MPITRHHGKFGALGRLTTEAGRVQRQAEIDDQVAREQFSQGQLEQRRGFQLSDAEMARGFQRERDQLRFQRQKEMKELDQFYETLDNQRKAQFDTDYLDSLDLDSLLGLGLDQKNAAQVMKVVDETRRGGLTVKESAPIVRGLVKSGITGNISPRERAEILAKNLQNKLDREATLAEEKDRTAIVKEEKAVIEKAQEKQQKILDARAKELQPLPGQIRKLRQTMVQARRKISAALKTSEGKFVEQKDVDTSEVDILEAYDEIKSLLEIFAPELAAQLPEAGDKPSGNKEIDAVKKIMPQLVRLLKDARLAAQTGRASVAPPTTQPDDIPPPEQREIGKIYTSPSGKVAKWTSTGWETVK